MNADTVEQLRIEADADQGVTSRVLDLLTAIDRFPQRMRLDREGCSLSISMELGPSSGHTPSLVARVRQIPGVRRVMALGSVVP